MARQRTCRPVKRRLIPPYLRLSALLLVVVLALFAAKVLFFTEGMPPPVAPDWVRQDLLPINPYSRPGTKLEVVNGLVIHYTANPGTTAEQNRSYFAGLAQTGETYASSNFMIGLDGEVLQLVPCDEMAYASNQRNGDTLSIEVCHQDETGAFTPESTDALILLVQWLVDYYQLSREDVLRHYDITGKDCPRYYVQHPEEWESFLNTIEF